MPDRYSPANPEGQRRLAARWFPAVPKNRRGTHHITFPGYDVKAGCRRDLNSSWWSGEYSPQLRLFLCPAEDSERQVRSQPRRAGLDFTSVPPPDLYLTAFDLKFGPGCCRPEPNLITPEIKCEFRGAETAEVERGGCVILTGGPAGPGGPASPCRRIIIFTHKAS